MKPAFVLVFALATAWGQTAKPVNTSAGIALTGDLGPRIAPQSFTNLEHSFDSTLRNFKDPVDILGGTRALYLRDYGVVLTTDVSLIITPGVSPFGQKIGKEEVARVHARKLAQVPLLKQAMRDMLKSAALAVAPALGPQYPESRLQVAFAVRLLNLPWEDSSGLPAQIIVKGDLRHAMLGELQVDEQ